MVPSFDPFTVLLDLSTGRLCSDAPETRRHLREMEGMYLDGGEVDGERLVYSVQPVPVPEDHANIFCSTTVIEPGTVGREYHMTKGHLHEVRDRGEFYLGLSGEGRLLLASENGDSRVEPLTPGTLNYIPGGWAHRSVNVGEGQLAFLSAYVADAGHDYGTIEEQGFPVLVVEGTAGPEVIDNPHYRG